MMIRILFLTFFLHAQNTGCMFKNTNRLPLKAFFLHNFVGKMQAQSTLNRATSLSLKEKLEISDFNADRDEVRLSQIALENMSRLVMMYIKLDCQQERERLLKSQISSPFHDSTVTTKVCLVDGKPAGFINYSVFLPQPWYKRLLPDAIAHETKIHHLVIDSKYRGKGYGSKLVKSAIQDSQEQSAHRITLWTTTIDLAKFYHKLGFTIVDQTVTKPQQYKFGLKLQPHPLKSLVEKTVMNVFFGWKKK